jgi:hypothetical protein
MQDVKNVVKYTGTLTEEKIEQTIESVFLKARRPGARVMTMYTGEAGMFNFQWTLTFGNTLDVKNYRVNFKRIQGTYFSLFTKHGRYKLSVIGKTFTVYEGTKVIKIFTDVESLELQNFGVFDKPQVHIDKMKIINNYLKTLENGSK